MAEHAGVNGISIVEEYASELNGLEGKLLEPSPAQGVLAMSACMALDMSAVAMDMVLDMQDCT